MTQCIHIALARLLCPLMEKKDKILSAHNHIDTGNLLGNVLNVFHLSFTNQIRFENIPQTPLDYCKQVGVGITQEQAQGLACPQALTPQQQELMSWYHCLYHTFLIRGSQAFSITDIHTQIITAFYVGIKLEFLPKQPF